MEPQICSGYPDCSKTLPWLTVSARLAFQQHAQEQQQNIHGVPERLQAQAEVVMLKSSYYEGASVLPWMCFFSSIDVKVNISEVEGSETNREIDFGFRSCVRARGGCKVRIGSK